MFKTTQEFCDYLEANHQEAKPLEAAAWFVCMQQAKDLCGLNLKDLATIVQFGLPKVEGDEVAAVQAWLDNFNQVVEDQIEAEEEPDDILAIIADFYGEGNDE